MCKTVIFVFILKVVIAQKDLTEGDPCFDPTGIEGICANVKECHLSTKIIKNRVNTTICGFNARDPIICCPRLNARLKSNSACEPYTPRRPGMKTGKIAFHKCIEYQEQIKFPCEPTDANGTVYSRRDACQDLPPRGPVDPNQRLGWAATRGEFPHMALLGYSKELSKPDTAEWLCGGTIISERFILTAGHCTVHSSLGPVAFARLGILKRTDDDYVIRDYSISRIIKHPEYQPPSKYNDIALLKTDKRIIFINKHIAPACLDVGDDEVESEAAMANATGWGEIDEWFNADILQVMEMYKFSDDECYAEFGPHRLLKSGLNSQTQICYGHRKIGRDTCTGDSGGPLQVEYSGVNCMFKVIGVTSFGKACGHTGQPGVYTRVRAYVPWIERVVWPEEDKYVFVT